MTVRELNEDQLEELKWSYFYEYENEQTEYEYPWEIPDEVIIDYLDGIYFVNDDFICTMGNF